MSGNEGADAPGGLASAWRTIALIAMGLVGVGVLLATVLFLSDANRQRDRALAAQRHSYDVMILARTLQGTIARSEASLGRYVISGDQALGQLYYDDWRRAGENIEQLRGLTRDNEAQTAQVAALDRAYRTRGQELALTALNTNYGKNNQALARFYHSSKALSLTSISRALDSIIVSERGLLEQRTSQAMASVRRSTVVAVVLAIFGVALLLGALALGWLTMSALAEAEAERQRADTLALAVADATEELRTQEARLRQVQKMEAVGQLTGGIAHDFNNMLAVVIGGIELARRNLASGGDVARHLDSAGDGATRAAALTKRLLAFARETAINPEPIRAAALFDDLADLLDRTLGDQITLRLLDQSDGWATCADRVQIENTLVNLAVNARDAMDGRGTLTIEAAAVTLAADETHGRGAGDYLSIAVTDTGCGMAPDVLERVFEPFFTTKPVGKGTGLGLSQAFAFARQLDGDVAIHSAPGRGTTVTLFLPRLIDAAVTPVADVAAHIPSPERAPMALRILVVEDDARVLAATVGALEELGHVVASCDDPLGALAALDAFGAIDLIVSDVLMPGRTGPEMIAGLPPRLAHVPVLFVTGFAGEVGDVDLGGRPVLRKPFTLAALEGAVAAVADVGGAGEALAAE